MVSGEAPFPQPIALGHEGVAEVVSAGPGAGVEPGTRVVVPFQISCGTCELCRRGLTANCKTVQPGSMYGFGQFGGDWGGLLSDLVRVPFAAHMLVPLPDGLAPEALASASDNIADAWRTVSPWVTERPGADVLVLGGGAASIALYSVAIAHALGAGEVVYIDTDAGRLALAAELGATPREGPPPRKAGSFQVVVEATGEHDGLACAIRSTAAGGRCTSVSIFFEETTPMPLLEMYTRGCDFHTGRCHARPVIPAILDLAAAGKLRPELVTSNTVSWDDAAEALLEPETKLVMTRV